MGKVIQFPVWRRYSVQDYIDKIHDLLSPHQILISWAECVPHPLQGKIEAIKLITIKGERKLLHFIDYGLLRKKGPEWFADCTIKIHHDSYN